MKTEKPPFKPRGKHMISFKDRTYLLTSKGERDRLIERLNFAYQKGHVQATKEIAEHSNKIMERFGI